MKDLQDVYIVEVEIYQLLEVIITERKMISDVEIQREIDLVMHAIKKE